MSRHVDLVYSAALRQVRSPQLAEDVAQIVFIDLSRNADKLAPDTILTAWLYRVTRHAAIDVVRSESRRQLREQIAVDLADMNSPDTHWKEIEPLLDEAMDTLDETDRASILLRYFENKTLREVGKRLGTSDDAAQKRVSRAVERLREFFSKRNVTVGASGLAVIISCNAVQASPIGIALTISTATATAITGTTIVNATTATAIKTIAMTTFQKSLITTILVAGLATPLIVHYRGQTQLREENSSLRQKLLQQLDATAQLVTDNTQLSKLVGQATNKSLSDEQFRELLRLRGEVGQLRDQKSELEKLRTENSQIRATRGSSAASPDDLGQRYFSKESWAFAGYANPESAFQSLVWAMSKGDLRAMLASVSPDEQVRMKKQFAGKSEEEIVAASGAEMESIKGFRILKNESVSDGDVILTIFNDGRDETAKIRVIRIGNEWKLAGRVKVGPR